MKIAAVLGGVVVALVGGCVAVGMVAGLDRTWEKGTAPVGAMVLQEVCGAATLAGVGIALWRLRLLWRGHGGAWALLAVFGALVLFALWLLAYAVEYSS